MRNNQDSYIRQSDYCHKYDKKGVKPNESRLKYSKIVCLKFYF